MQIYEACGYTARDAVQNILLHNLYGLDIDERAAQLSYFAVMMKARQYDSRFFRRVAQPHVYAVAESNHAEGEAVAYFCKGDAALTKTMQTILDELHDAKEYGSILSCTAQDWDALYARFGEVYDDISLHRDETLALLPLVQTAEALSQKYDVVVTNPPYMGGSGMNQKMIHYLKTHYDDSKSDLYAVFIERCISMAKDCRYVSLITQNSWMFLYGYERLRKKLQNTDIINLAHLGPRAFDEIGGEVVQTTSFVLANSRIRNRKGRYVRLIEPTSQQGKEDLFLSGKRQYISNQDSYSIVPGMPIAYWISDHTLQLFNKQKLVNYLDARNGMSTTDNDRFLRYWFECSYNRIKYGSANAEIAKQSNAKWFPYDKGGSFRRWYGNKDYVVNWENDGEEMKRHVGAKYGSYSKELRSEDRYFHEGITWSTLSSGNISLRYCDCGSIFDSKGSKAFAINGANIYSILAYLNSKVVQHFLSVLSPTLDYNNGSLNKLPYIPPNGEDTILTTCHRSIDISKDDWDSFETSWDFKRHPLV